MLRTFTKHFNETVFRGPDNEGGTDVVVSDNISDATGGDSPADDGDGDSGDNESEPSKPLSVREELKKSIEEVRAAEEGKVAPKRRDKQASSARATKEVAPVTSEKTPASADDIPVPASLGPEAKAAWAAAPKEIKEAFVKREADMQKGVEELKQRYDLIDKAIAPHNDALRQMNATPAVAVDRMFLWFKALAGTPAAAFPALAKSMGIDWDKLATATVQAAQAQQGQAQQQPAPADGASPDGAPQIPPELRDYIGKLEQQVQNLSQGFQQFGGRFQSMEESVQQQNMARTTENLNIWSKDKPYFNEVRQEMAHLLQSGMIPLKADGQVDLDKAYEHAIYFNPEVRAKVIAEQQQANLKAQEEANAAATTASQAQTDKAKKAAVSIPSRSTPGAGNGAPRQQQKKPGQQTSVRDSLKSAISQLREQ